MGEKCRFDIDGIINYHFTMTITIDGAGRVVIPKIKGKTEFNGGCFIGVRAER